MRWLLALLLSLLPLTGWAQSYPATHSVTGVADDDVLNIRPTPGTTGAPIGAFAPGTTGIEVIRVSDDGLWGLVNAGEGIGWVAMRYLAREGLHEAFPAPAECFGTEPFWSIVLDRNGVLELTTFEGEEMLMSIQARFQAEGRSDRFSLVATSSNEATLHGVIARAQCNDGMSDREYGLVGDFLILNASGYRHLSGCCSLTNQSP